MAQKKKKTRAEQAAAAAKNKLNKGQKNTSKKEGNDKKVSKFPIRLITSVVFLGMFILCLVIFFNPDGVLTGFLANILQGILGQVAFAVSIPVLLYLFFIHAFSGKRPILMRSVCLGAFVVICGALSQLAQDSQGLTVIELWTGGVQGSTGGLLCGGVGLLLQWLCGNVLSYIILIVAGLLTLLGGMQITIPSIIRAIQERPRAEWENDEEDLRQEPASVVVNHIASKRIAHKEQKRREAVAAAEANVIDEVPVVSDVPRTDTSRANDIMKQIDSDVNSPVVAAGVASKEVIEEEILPITPKKIEEDFPETMPELVQEDVTTAPVAEAPKPVLEKKPAKVTAQEAAESAAEVAMEIQQAEAEVKPVYYFPPIDLLKLPGRSSGDATAEMRENANRLNETLASFKIEAHIINVTRGPSVTRYEVELEKGVRLNKLTSVADDIALSLGASGVRIAAVPGKISVVGIEVPNRAVTTVSLREVIDSQEFHKAKSLSSFAVGKDIGGNCIVGNIAKLPHMLIAGTTGSGKSVCMNSIIISLLYKASPDDVKLIMIDPKMVELGIYNGIPHLLIPVVTDPKKAAGSLQWAVTEMMRRYKIMSDVGVRDLESYNSIIDSQEVDGKRFEQVVVIIDELADLMLVAAKEVEESICRIAQMGRAAGIHLIIATQRPSADVITGLMKANIPSRIAFAVASAMESRIILDTPGAEKLVGRGDMLFAPIGTGKPQRVQGCFVSDQEVEAVATHVKSKFISQYDQNIMEEIEKKAAQTGNKPTAATTPEPNSEEQAGDEMLPAAVDVILETGQASVSMLQRRLKLGYARAARIVDEMEEKGIVGPFQGSKPRAILITKEQWESMKSGSTAQMDFDDLEEDYAVPEDF